MLCISCHLNNSWYAVLLLNISVNIFQSNFEQRLKYWYKLRNDLLDTDTKNKCLGTDKFWQTAPLVNHYLYTDSVNEWPDPWELISENHYCYIARGLGIFYTMHLLGVKDIAFVEAKDYNNEDVALVLVDSAKYILNYWPDTVLNNCLQEFKIVRYIDTATIISKIGFK